ncbi:transient receptor potential channel pyrexia, putative [Pediculus humanus corporis]|uniref:Transient receptor potential channel pyrexia, putative n=1 Tax=Pediculus humanus subsp. corporis TaxID=121224 RepID=E0W076_PEDHC|nr:transient receptor potential channel pyrexia, putative [Pediculus humanus corporis]EEB19032.1 transient receptor potential channel pyrexia, putative [Pediculus humanus corporis]
MNGKRDVEEQEVIDDDDDDNVSNETEEIGAAGNDTDQPQSLQIQEIWHKKEILESLNILPGSQELQSLIAARDYKRVLSHPNSSLTGLLLASFSGNAELLQAILRRSMVVNVRDREGRTPLHLACCAGSAECVKILLDHKAMPNVWNKEGVITPLHCAASVGNIQCLKLLLDAGAILDAGLTTTGFGKTPLYYAVLSNSINCVEELLKRNASINTSQVYTETPLHVAAAMGFASCLKLLLDHGADFRVKFGTAKSTPLHLAAEDGNAECAKLLIEAGADLMSRTNRIQTPLHLAALAQSVQTLELLLMHRADPNAEDIDKRTPLHCAIVKSSRSCDSVQLLLQYGAKVNAPDVFGYTPVHIAALNEFPNCLKLLLDHGGDVTKRTNGNVSALSFIARRTPEILKYLERKLDQGIRLHDHEIGDVDCEIKLDFRVLVPSLSSGIFLDSCADFKKCTIPMSFRYVSYVLLVCNFSILGKELFQIAHIRRGYIYQWENWLQWLIILAVFVTLVPPNWLSLKFVTWQHHIAVFGIFFNWIELMVLIGRFPMFGLYVQMFTKGAVNFGKFLLAYFCLLAAFSFSFRMLFPKYPSFNSTINSIVKIVAMMTGELEFEDIFFNSEDPLYYPGTSHIFFLFFTLIVTVVLTNLLVGLSVSDIQGLQTSAGLDRLTRQVELVAYMESMLFSRLLNWIPKKILRVCHRSALLLSSPRQFTLIIKPNDPREKRIPKELVKEAYKCVSERRGIQSPVLKTEFITNYFERNRFPHSRHEIYVSKRKKRNK